MRPSDYDGRGYEPPYDQDCQETYKTIDRLQNLVNLATLAIGTHNAPDDCYSTGPRTGNPIQDLVICPACAFLKALNECQQET